jgi:hypothetical protein
MKFSPLPCYLVPLRPKYPPEHPILKHPQPRTGWALFFLPSRPEMSQYGTGHAD